MSIFDLVELMQYASALNHFTGSKDHNIKMRQIAKEQGKKISEYGVELADGHVKHFNRKKNFMLILICLLSHQQFEKMDRSFQS